MPKPSSVYTWATDANHTDPPETWDGTPNKTAPAAGLQATGYLPKQRPAVNTFNYLKNVDGEWLDWHNTGWQSDGDWSFPDGNRNETISISPLNGTSERESGAGNTPGWSVVGLSQITAFKNDVNWFIDITPFLPDDGSFTSVEARVSPGAARATVGNRMALSVWEVDNTAVPPTETQLGSTDTDDGSATANQLLQVAGLAASVDKAGDRKSFIVRIKSGNDSGTNNDELRQINVAVSYPGPRSL